MRTAKKITDRLIVALGLALEEIHHPGANRNAGIDITALCEGVLKEASGTDIRAMASDELAQLAKAENHTP